jgi:hypothetical protein
MLLAVLILFLDGSFQPYLQQMQHRPIHARCALVDLAAGVGMEQNIGSVPLVVQGIEPVVRRFLRFGM